MMRKAVIAALALLAFTAGARADDAYPNRAITLIIPFAPGGSTDVIGRLVAEGMRQALGQSVVADNRAGAGGSIGTAAIAKAVPDGYTIGMGTASTLAINPATYKTLPFDVLTDLTPIGNIAAVPNIMSLNPDVKAADMRAFIALAKSQPGKLGYGSSGHGSVSHLLGEQFKLATGTDLVHVPYRGMGPALNGAVSGQVQVVFDNLPTSLELVKGGRLRALAVSGERRVEALPDTPTFGELGIEEANWMAFFGLVAPKDTPAPIVQRINEEIAKASHDPELVRRLTATGTSIRVSAPDEMRSLMVTEQAHVVSMVERLGLRDKQ